MAMPGVVPGALGQVEPRGAAAGRPAAMWVRASGQAAAMPAWEGPAARVAGEEEEVALVPGSPVAVGRVAAVGLERAPGAAGPAVVRAQGAVAVVALAGEALAGTTAARVVRAAVRPSRPAAAASPQAPVPRPWGRRSLDLMSVASPSAVRPFRISSATRPWAPGGGAWHPHAREAVSPGCAAAVTPAEKRSPTGPAADVAAV